MTAIIESIRAEYLRYKALAEAAIAQLDEAELAAHDSEYGNSVTVMCWHLSGNLQSRFTDFLTSDGEKPWRQREEEFQARLTDEQLQQSVTIRGQSLRVHEALHRSLAHAAYHVGQIVYVAKSQRGKDWTFLSIPPGKSDAYNRTAHAERPAAHANVLSAIASKNT